MWCVQAAVRAATSESAANQMGEKGTGGWMRFGMTRRFRKSIRLRSACQYGQVVIGRQVSHISKKIEKAVSLKTCGFLNGLVNWHELFVLEINFFT